MTVLKDRPNDKQIDHDLVSSRDVSRIYDEWFEVLERKFKEMDFAQWYKDNILNIMARFDLHSASGIHPKECLQYFVEKEILGQ